MAFTKLTKSVLNISALPDRVENQAQTLKATFDQAGVDIKDAHNALIVELEADTSAESLGAKNPNGEASTIQAELTNIYISLTGKIDKAEGKQLSTEDFTTEEKTKLAGIAEGANNYVLPEASTTILGGIKVDGNTIVVENGVAKAKASDAADYTARASIEALSNNVLTKDNTIEYTPTEAYHPATKQYVDDLDIVTEVTAADVIPGTFSGVIKANSSAVENLETAQIRNITASTTDLTAGTSTLATGEIYFVYE